MKTIIGFSGKSAGVNQNNVVFEMIYFEYYISLYYFLLCLFYSTSPIQELSSQIVDTLRTKDLRGHVSIIFAFTMF